MVQSAGSHTQEINIHNVLNRLEPIGEESQISSSIKQIQQQIESLHNKRNSDGITQVNLKRKGNTEVPTVELHSPEIRSPERQILSLDTSARNVVEISHEDIYSPLKQKSKVCF